jgi:IQ calmodulin-binding motif
MQAVVRGSSVRSVLRHQALAAATAQRAWRNSTAVRRSRRTQRDSQRDSAAVRIQCLVRRRSSMDTLAGLKAHRLAAAVKLQKLVRGWLVRSRLQGRRVPRSPTQQQQQQQQRLAEGNWRRAPVRSLSASEAASSTTALPRAVSSSRENASEGGSLDLVRVGVISASAAAAAAAAAAAGGSSAASGSSSCSPRHSVHTAAQRSGDWLLSPLPPVPRRSSSTSPPAGSRQQQQHQQYQQQQQHLQQPFDLNAGACLLSAIRRKLHSPAELPGPRSRGASPPREPLNYDKVMWSCVRQPEGLLWWRKHALVLSAGLELGPDDLLPVLQASTAAGLHVKSLQLSGNKTEGVGLGQWLQV